MNVRLALGSIRLRIDEMDLAALAAGKSAETAVTLPDKKGEARAFRCILAVEEAGPGAKVEPHAIRITLSREHVASLQREAEEAVAFIQPPSPGSDAAEVVVSVEKDRREFGRAAARGAMGRRGPR